MKIRFDEQEIAQLLVHSVSPEFGRERIEGVDFVMDLGNFVGADVVLTAPSARPGPWPDFVTRLVTRHRDFNMGDCWHNDLARLRAGAEPESRNADLADTLDWLVALHRGVPTSTDGGST